jgi:hypothetical protein
VSESVAGTEAIVNDLERQTNAARVLSPMPRCNGPNVLPPLFALIFYPRFVTRRGSRGRRLRCGDQRNDHRGGDCQVAHTYADDYDERWRTLAKPPLTAGRRSPNRPRAGHHVRVGERPWL